MDRSPSTGQDRPETSPFRLASALLAEHLNTLDITDVADACLDKPAYNVRMSIRRSTRQLGL